MTANTTKTQGSMSDDNENSSEDSQISDRVTEEVKHPSIIEPEKITETAPQQESTSSFKWGKTLLGLGVFALLTGNILVLTNHLKPSSSMAGMEGMDHGNMSHDEMMAVDGSFNPNPVRIETVKPQVLEASVSYTGTIKPYEEIMVYPRVAGQLTNYSVYPGDRYSNLRIFILVAVCYTCYTSYTDRAKGLKVRIMSSNTVAVRLQEELNQRLTSLATKTGRSKSFYIKQALLRYLEDMEDTYLAIDRIENPGERVSMEDAKRILDVED